MADNISDLDSLPEINLLEDLDITLEGLQEEMVADYQDRYEEGTRFSSGANFRFNIFNINFGMAVYI